MTDNTAKVPDFTHDELIGSYHDAMVETYTFVSEKIMPHINQGLVGEIKDDEQAILGIFYRMHALAASMTRLNHKLDFNAMALIARTLFELLLDLKLLAKGTPEDFERFKNFARVERFKKFDKLIKLQKENSGIDNHSFFDSQSRKVFVEDSNRAKEISSIINKLWGEKFPDHWSGLTIRGRAKDFGPLYEQEYLEIYSLLSWYAHAGNAAYAGFSEFALAGVYKIALDVGRKMYIEGLIICARKFSLPDVLENFFKVVNFLSDAPKEILIEYGLEKIKQKKA